MCFGRVSQAAEELLFMPGGQYEPIALNPQKNGQLPVRALESSAPGADHWPSLADRWCRLPRADQLGLFYLFGAAHVDLDLLGLRFGLFVQLELQDAGVVAGSDVLGVYR